MGDAHPIVLYVGSDHPRKNLGVALEAFARLQKGRPDAVFLKVGSPGLPAGREATLEKIDKLGIREAIRFVGAVEEEKLNQLYSLADVFVYPSKFEGFGLPPLQAMAAGTPVICSNATSLPEVVGEAAIMHDADDVNGFAESLKKIVTDKELAQSLRENGLERVQQFSWTEAVERVAEVYKKIASV